MDKIPIRVVVHHILPFIAFNTINDFSLIEHTFKFVYGYFKRDCTRKYFQIFRYYIKGNSNWHFIYSIERNGTINIKEYKDHILDALGVSY